MRIETLTDGSVNGLRGYRLACGGDAVGSLAWDGRGSFAFEMSGSHWSLLQPDAVDRAQLLGKGGRQLLVEGDLEGRISTHREKDGLLGTCVSYVLETKAGEVLGYPNPGGGRGWRMSVYRDGGQIALVRRPSVPVHTPDGSTVVAIDEDAAAGALALMAYDVYTSFLENDGGAAGPFGFRFVNLFGRRAAKLDDPTFEARVEGELSEKDEAAEKASESAQDRAARLASGFAVKGDIVDRRS